jgi:O-methyltransferase involved in polyketide biosynthesis
MTAPTLTTAEDSLWLTLCGHAIDSRRARPFLGDPVAADIAARAGRDCGTFPMPASSVTDIALRAKKLDGMVHRFVTAHPDAVVLDLGVGLDHRTARVPVPSTVDWYDVDTDPHEPQRWEPRLRLAQELLLTRQPEVAAYPPALRLWTRLAALSTAVSRRGTTVLRYRFTA